MCTCPQRPEEDAGSPCGVDFSICRLASVGAGIPTLVLMLDQVFLTIETSF